jgi:hypothetical protein
MYNYECDYSLIVQVIPSVIGSSLSFYIPLLLNIIARVKICLKVRNRSILLCNEEMIGDSALQRQRHDLEARVTKTIMILQGIFIVCTSPFFVLLLLESLLGVQISDRIWFIVTWLGYSNSMINPYLYCFLHKRTERREIVCHRTHKIDSGKTAKWEDYSTIHGIYKVSNIS